MSNKSRFQGNSEWQQVVKRHGERANSTREKDRPVILPEQK
jgi:hypothetical protein